MCKHCAFESFVVRASAKAPSKRIALEREVIRQLVAGREDAARSLYAAAKNRQLDFIKKNLTKEANKLKRQGILID